MHSHSQPALIADASLPDLLEANLRALHAILDEQHRALGQTLRAVSTLLSDLRALGSPSAPWVQALQETRALLFVALREVVVGGGDAGATQAFERSVADAADAHKVARNQRQQQHQQPAQPAPKPAIAANVIRRPPTGTQAPRPPRAPTGVQRTV